MHPSAWPLSPFGAVAFLLLVTISAAQAADPEGAALAERARALPVRLAVEDEGAFRHLLLEKIGKA